MLKLFKSFGVALRSLWPQDSPLLRDDPDWTETCPFPHCDSEVLHAPGTCQYCDHYKRMQHDRIVKFIAFTNESEWEGCRSVPLHPCPATLHRSAEIIHRWPGNQAQKGVAMKLTFPIILTGVSEEMIRKLASEIQEKADEVYVDFLLESGATNNPPVRMLIGQNVLAA